MNHRLYPSFLLATAVMLLLATAARAAESDVSTLKFSDPSKPGTLKVTISQGDLRIRGTDAAEITVKSDAQAVTSAPRKDGLRVLTAASSFTLTEKDNVAVLEYGADRWGGDGADFTITVPHGTNLVITGRLGSDVHVTDVAGNVEIKSLNGDVVLEGLGGSATVETVNGEIKASFTQAFSPDKPLSFSSVNGEISIRVPEDAKANVRLSTQNGSILTDFDDKSLVTKTEIMPRGKSSTHTRTVRIPAKSTGTPPAPPAPVASVPPVPAVAPAAPVTPDTPADDADSREALRAAAHEAARASAEAGRAIAETVRISMQAAHEAMAARGIPSMTGGKLVTGTLNGGGPEVSIYTVNGDVTLRKLK